MCEETAKEATAERNAERARRASRVVVGYSGAPCKAGYESSLIDLLTELRHWCDAENIDYVAADQQAQRCHDEEVQGLDG